MDTIKVRLKHLARFYGMSIRAFEESCGLNRGNISNMNDEGSVGSDKLSKIFDRFKDVNPIWLISGSGEMLKSSRPALGDTELHEPSVEYASFKNSPESLPVMGIDDRVVETEDVRRVNLRPRIPFDAEAGALSVIADSIALKDCEMLPVIPTFPRYDFTMPIHGDSMVPEFHSGDEVACRFIREKAFLQWGRVHVLDTRDGAVLKRIYEVPDGILCKSNNPANPDFVVPKEDILQMALVVGMLRRY